MNTATTIEQSRKLWNLGIDPETADFHYGKETMHQTDLRLIFCPYAKAAASYRRMTEAREGSTFNGVDMRTHGKKGLAMIIPAWSLAALIAVLPDTIEVYDQYDDGYIVHLKIEKDCGKWWVGYGDVLGGSDSDRFTACIDLIEQLVEQGYIKTKKE